MQDFPGGREEEEEEERRRGRKRGGGGEGGSDIKGRVEGIVGKEQRQEWTRER